MDTNMLIKPRAPRICTYTEPLRQNQIAFLLRWGLGNKEIARVLGCSGATVKVHMKALLLVLNLANRTQIAVIACKQWGIPDECDRAPTSEAELNRQLFDSGEESPTALTEPAPRIPCVAYSLDTD